jgi:hypothetical protein
MESGVNLEIGSVTSETSGRRDGAGQSGAVTQNRVGPLCQKAVRRAALAYLSRYTHWVAGTNRLPSLSPAPQGRRTGQTLKVGLRSRSS